MVLFMAPKEVIAEWMKKPEAERQAAETKMRADWDTWMSAHADVMMKTIALGKTKRVSSAGVEDTKNDLMLSSYAQGESADAVAAVFTDHPHLGIPGATIEIIETRQM